MLTNRPATADADVAAARTVDVVAAEYHPPVVVPDATAAGVVGVADAHFPSSAVKVRPRAAMDFPPSAVKSVAAVGSVVVSGGDRDPRGAAVDVGAAAMVAAVVEVRYPVAHRGSDPERTPGAHPSVVAVVVPAAGSVGVAVGDGHPVVAIVIVATEAGMDVDPVGAWVIRLDVETHAPQGTPGEW